VGKLELHGWRTVTRTDPVDGERVCGLNVFSQNCTTGFVDRKATKHWVRGELAKSGRAVVVIDRMNGKYVPATHYMPLPDPQKAALAFQAECRRDAVKKRKAPPRDRPRAR